MSPGSDQQHGPSEGDNDDDSQSLHDLGFADIQNSPNNWTQEWDCNTWNPVCDTFMTEYNRQHDPQAQSLHPPSCRPNQQGLLHGPYHGYFDNSSASYDFLSQPQLHHGTGNPHVHGSVDADYELLGLSAHGLPVSEPRTIIDWQEPQLLPAYQPSQHQLLQVEMQPDPNHQRSLTLVPDVSNRRASSGTRAAASNASYAELIYLCLLGAKEYTRTLGEIYEWFIKHTTKARDPTKKGWQNSIRHNLSMNDAFERVVSTEHSDTKRNSRWRLTKAAVQAGAVVSTTRYRKDYKDRSGRRRRTLPASTSVLRGTSQADGQVKKPEYTAEEQPSLQMLSSPVLEDPEQTRGVGSWTSPAPATFWISSPSPTTSPNVDQSLPFDVPATNSWLNIPSQEALGMQNSHLVASSADGSTLLSAAPLGYWTDVGGLQENWADTSGGFVDDSNTSGDALSNENHWLANHSVVPSEINTMTDDDSRRFSSYTTSHEGTVFSSYQC